jgi:hypothetical protein
MVCVLEGFILILIVVSELRVKMTKLVRIVIYNRYFTTFSLTEELSHTILLTWYTKKLYNTLCFSFKRYIMSSVQCSSALKTIYSLVKNMIKV